MAGPHDPDVPEPEDHEHGLPDGPDNASVSRRGVRVKGPGLSQRGVVIIGGVVATVAIMLFFGLGLFNGKPNTTVTVVPTMAPNKQVAEGANVDKSLPTYDPTLPQSKVTLAPNASTASGVAGGSDADALNKTLAAASASSAPIPTFAPGTPVPAETTPPGTTNYNNIPVPPPNVPNPGSANNAPSQQVAQTQTIGKATLYVGGEQAGNVTAPSAAASVPDRSAGSAPVQNGGPMYDPSTVGKPVNSNLAFANDTSTKDHYLNEVRHKPAGKYELWAGSNIGAQLDTGLNTNLPGTATAHIVNDVYDSPTGQFLLIPKGTKIVGKYNSQVNAGQNRIQIAWDELIWPDGSYLSLEGAEGADREGNAGLFADVNDHRGSVLTASLLTAVLAAGSQIASGNQSTYTTNSAGQLIQQSVGQQVAQQGGAIIAQKAAIPPELTVPRGENFNITIRSTIILSPWTYGN